MSHRPFKERLYAQFERIGAALASARRLEILDLLSQAPRNVESLAGEMEQSVANISQHLQVLRGAGLVETAREGNRVYYRLSDPSVAALWHALRSVGETHLAEVDRIRREFGLDQAPGTLAAPDAAQSEVKARKAVLVDVRPEEEFRSGHLPGAISIPADQLAARIDELPRDRKVIAYCRGSYCLFADEAVDLLKQHGFEAVRLDGGWLEWLVEGRTA